MKNKTYWPDNTMYFLTGTTFLHYPYFKNDDQKLILLNQFKKIQQKLNILISAYSIAINHYHLKFFLKNGSDISMVKQIINGGASYLYRQKYEMKHKELWQNFKVLKVFNENINNKITGYVAGNLLKHKEVSTFDELYDNKFSSYKYMVDKYGVEYSKNLIYSVIDIDESAEGDIILNAFN